MSGIFGWSLPPGCSSADIDRAFGEEGPLDCPVCVDGVDLQGPDCSKDPLNHGVTCPTHGCLVCGDLEKKRIWCASPLCSDYIRAGVVPVTRNGKTYCSEPCSKVVDNWPTEEETATF